MERITGWWRAKGDRSYDLWQVTSPSPGAVKERRGLWNPIDQSTSHPSGGVVGRHHGVGVSGSPGVILNPDSLLLCSANNSVSARRESLDKY